jgi:circadian clock protein KaiB
LTRFNALKPIKPRRAMKVLAKSRGIQNADKYFFRLYVAGASSRSREALRRIHQLCEAELKDNYILEVIDVYQQPQLARDSQIIATPTLVKQFPLPARRFIGSLPNAASLFGESKLFEEAKVAL